MLVSRRKKAAARIVNVPLRHENGLPLWERGCHLGRMDNRSTLGLQEQSFFVPTKDVVFSLMVSSIWVNSLQLAFLSTSLYNRLSFLLHADDLPLRGWKGESFFLLQ